MIQNFCIKTPRQMRAINALLEKESIEIKELGILAGALNPGQVIFELRAQGFQEIILTQFFERFDRDGKLCRVGRYVIPEIYKNLIREVLERGGFGTASQKTRPHTVIQDDKSDDKERA